MANNKWLTLIQSKVDEYKKNHNGLPPNLMLIPYTIFTDLENEIRDTYNSTSLNLGSIFGIKVIPVEEFEIICVRTMGGN